MVYAEVDGTAGEIQSCRQVYCNFALSISEHERAADGSGGEARYHLRGCGIIISPAAVGNRFMVDRILNAGNAETLKTDRH